MINMFIKLTTRTGVEVIYNTNHIKTIRQNEKGMVVLELGSGTDIVKETLEEIMKKLKGSDQLV